MKRQYAWLRKKPALLVLTPHTELGTTRRRTRFYYDETATLYWVRVDAGFDVEIGSVMGGFTPPASKADVAESPQPNGLVFYE